VEATDEEVEHAKRLGATLFDSWAVSVHRGNVGYARACNEAAERLGDQAMDTYAFFNADTRITSGALKICDDVLWSDESYAVVGPRQIGDNGEITHAGVFGALDHPRHRGWREPAGDKYTDIRDDCVTVSGAAYFVKQHVWWDMADCPLYQESDPGSLGAFLQTPHYFEETFLSYHSICHGYKVVFVGSATILHRWHKASPVGGWAEQQFPISQAIFREACSHHGIPHD
jgi:GT2 family glycosyltransferase